MHHRQLIERQRRPRDERVTEQIISSSFIKQVLMNIGTCGWYSGVYKAAVMTMLDGCFMQMSDALRVIVVVERR